MRSAPVGITNSIVKTPTRHAINAPKKMRYVNPKPPVFKVQEPTPAFISLDYWKYAWCCLNPWATQELLTSFVAKTPHTQLYTIILPGFTFPGVA